MFSERKLQYETAAKRYEGGPNVTIVLYLCRSWYAKANRDQSYSELLTALKYAQQVSRPRLWRIMRVLRLYQALHLQPTDKAVLYNIAMIEQKATEMIFTIPPAKRSLRDLQRAIDQGVHATKYVAHVKVPKCKY